MTIQPRKRFAQHWLRSDKALNKIVQAAELSDSDRLLEIGPGTGILTHRLLPLAASVVAVEIDRDLCQKLVKKIGSVENFLLLQGDILSLDLETNLAQFPAFQNPNKVVANIPYNITGPILEKLLGTIAQPVANSYDLIVLLLQKEVADRICARPDSKAYSSLSVKIQYLANCEFICDVPAKAFYPPPKVDSAVIRLRPQLIEPQANNPKQMETLVKLGFSSKRKMLRNNLKAVIERDRLFPLLEKLKVNPQVRAEDLSVQQWVALANSIEPI
ncbi:MULTISPECIES: 16S rRNA (adenine(1518)-N(6)/adenine(1519)-N(6))-dimethyltransferase RsmA [Okeania]|uniref:Ribosomal RNA small subunit methyltransferase A n=1 Tax=Okeania hirsuta TaxID=1458930 RepID=A0A3N6P9J1_9CYAN|nr:MULTISPECIES: 16S rRNA (adenine(1518)-N(6)/adenine(1519)-N(6))-dimethyltransferase RsmA [Okeania]NET12530.1 16S rRNA (adenine(1518)-N(6)/adenine(1519)-N(6))-dimethyltransferase RsmA [Okeania sp. SIO1H6]NES76606.1 16S rRNA (adenine(1518)-N(6)/adenine(1519)-N(6))-dimethyltransferase RsmA [Okeania sp. SIO1H4]NES89599.1 16S rRNA (adenine(1518)-N(6)/adenine(1519)-N(6))-dimethyltransferase RsmA [Okeania sp. SIO2B9]NET20201.1 16S rRNA (adenine(1518)-N(6)/adenine(1519)-N(6))-dimethyltransferase RsmA